MKCMDPKIAAIATNGSRQFRHFSLANPLFIMRHTQVFDCDTCIFCRKKRSFELASRCVLHASLYTHNCFLTLTYDETDPEYHNNFQYEDIQKFKKALRVFVNTVEYSHIKTRKLKRRRVPKQYYRKIEIFNVHEYGKNGKKHWHLVVFNYDFSDKTIHSRKNNIPLYTSKTLEKLWKHGFVTIGDVSEASAMYQAQYTQKDIKNNNLTNGKKSHSKHQGIGRPYFMLHYRQILTLGYVPIGNRKMPIPRYFQRIAHKHYSHFYDRSAFYSNSERKEPLYRFFDDGEANKEIADLFIYYTNLKQEKINELTKEWNDVVNQYLNTNEEPEFLKSAHNYLYDLKNKITEERF